MTTTVAPATAEGWVEVDYAAISGSQDPVVRRIRFAVSVIFGLAGFGAICFFINLAELLASSSGADLGGTLAMLVWTTFFTLIGAAGEWAARRRALAVSNPLPASMATQLSVVEIDGGGPPAQARPVVPRSVRRLQVFGLCCLFLAEMVRVAGVVWRGDAAELLAVPPLCGCAVLLMWGLAVGPGAISARRVGHRRWLSPVGLMFVSRPTAPAALSTFTDEKGQSSPWGRAVRVRLALTAAGLVVIPRKQAPSKALWLAMERVRRVEVADRPPRRMWANRSFVTVTSAAGDSLQLLVRSRGLLDVLTATQPRS